MADKYLCVHCRKPVAATKAGRFTKHPPGADDPCMGSGEFIPAPQVAKGPIDPKAPADVPEDGRDYGRCTVCGAPSVPLSFEGRLNPHTASGRQGICPGSEQEYQWTKNARPSDATAEAPPAVGSSANPMKREEQFLPPPPASESPTPSSSPMGSEEFLPPAPPPVSDSPMTPFGEEVAARFKEIFHAYGQRRTSDNRSAQSTLGPSEIGTPCDRRLALSLLKVAPVNPGGDGWAAFKGTAVHASLAEMFTWASGDSGRFAVEVPLTFPYAFMPKGTSDLLDRTLFMVGDFKIMGFGSLKKLKTKGPSLTYRVQAHLYAYGQRLKGERVDRVAILGLPMDEPALSGMHVWEEPYDATVAIKAIERAQKIQERIEFSPPAAGDALGFAHTFPAAPDCTYCPFYAPGDRLRERGCRGD